MKEEEENKFLPQLRRRSLLQIIVGVVCLCAVANVAFAQNYYDEYQQQPQQQQQHRPAPARLSPSNGPVETKPMPVAILKQINRYVGVAAFNWRF